MLSCSFAPKSILMKKVVFFLVAVAAVFAVYWFMFRGDSGPEAPKQQALTVGKHSAVFNSSIDSLVQAYIQLKDAFTQSDTVKVKSAALAFSAISGTTNLDDLKSDTTGIYETAAAILGDIKQHGETITRQATLNYMRMSFKDLSDNLYPFLKTIHYEGGLLYWQNCPAAFGADQAANWISKGKNDGNPYLGAAQSGADCGEVQDSIMAH